MRIHPPHSNPANWIPFVFGLAGVFAIPWMLQLLTVAGMACLGHVIRF
ncbi:hypothetical protein JW933_08705 [candidate division FCPU426 bacterium]|nr:hypothetical protein [candidate division FCPU426 bacterium]